MMVAHASILASFFSGSFLSTNIVDGIMHVIQCSSQRPALASFREYSRTQFDVLPWCPTLWLLESGDTEILALSGRPLFSAPLGTQSALSFCDGGTVTQFSQCVRS